MAIAYVALGANLGDRLATLRHAIARMGELGTIEAVSPAYETAPVGYIEQPAFLNAVARLRTDLAPEELMTRLLAIEAETGRVRTFRNAPRTLDLDLLFYDDRVLHVPGLTLPHPRLHERPFVLVPLADIAPTLVHPVMQVPASELLRRLGSVSGVAPYGAIEPA